MIQSEVNEKFRNAMQRVVETTKEFNGNMKEFIERYSEVGGELQDDYEEDILESEVEDTCGYVNDLIDELQGIHDDLTQIAEEGIEEDLSEREEEEGRDED